MNRQPIFDAIRDLIGRGFRQWEVDLIDDAIDRATGAIAANPPPRRRRMMRVRRTCGSGRRAAR